MEPGLAVALGSGLTRGGRHRNRSHTQTHNKNTMPHDTTRTTPQTTTRRITPPPALDNDRRWRGDGLTRRAEVVVRRP